MVRSPSAPKMLVPPFEARSVDEVMQNRKLPPALANSEGTSSTSGERLSATEGRSAAHVQALLEVLRPKDLKAWLESRVRCS